MAIHHSTKTKAEKIGVMLREAPDGAGKAFPEATFDLNVVEAYWPKFNVYAYGAGDKPAQAAMEEMAALQKIKDKLPGCSIVNDQNDPFLVRVFLTHERLQVLDHEASTPKDALLMIEQDKVWQSTTVPADGGEAHKQGFPITDNPFDEENDADDFAAWDEAWEASADEADAAEDEPDTGSVVKQTYRIRYAELGHPAHCGDELAVTFNNLTQDDKGKLIVEKVDAIAGENGVSLAKYDRSNNGWQGRLRMTARNLLARVVFLNDGVLRLPEGLHPDGVREVKMPDNWMAAQRFKKPKASKTEESVEATPAEE